MIASSLAGTGQISRPVASRQEAILPNANETTRQNTLGESPESLRGTQGHFGLFASMGIVFPAEGNPLTIEGQQSVVTDSDALDAEDHPLAVNVADLQAAQFAASQAAGIHGQEHCVMDRFLAESISRVISSGVKIVGRRLAHLGFLG